MRRSSSRIIVSGGYDYDFVSDVPDDFNCLICTLVQRDAHQVTCCGKIYCSSCLEELKKKATNSSYMIGKIKCPNCHSSMNGDNKLFPDKNTISKINHLRIHCTNKERGCQWVGHLKDLDTVHIPKCPNEIIECTNKQSLFAVCGSKVERRNLAIHMINECKWRTVTCPHCNKEGKYICMSLRHTQLCPDIEIVCNNDGCNMKIKRGLLTKHRDECPKQLIDCPYRHIGCKKTMIREEMAIHTSKEVSQHLDQAVLLFDAALQRIGVLETEQSVATKQIKELSEASANNGYVVKLNGILKPDDATSIEFCPSEGGPMVTLIAISYVDLGDQDFIDLYVAPVPGEYDHFMQWPCKGTVTVQLLNQEKDADHEEHTANFHFEKPEDKNTDDDDNNTFDDDDYNDSFVESYNVSNYLVDDTLYFRVKLNVKTKCKNWLV